MHTNTEKKIILTLLIFTLSILSKQTASSYVENRLEIKINLYLCFILLIFISRVILKDKKKSLIRILNLHKNIKYLIVIFNPRHNFSVKIIECII